MDILEDGKAVPISNLGQKLPVRQFGSEYVVSGVWIAHMLNFLIKLLPMHIAKIGSHELLSKNLLP
jgi:hypothetical protein